PPPPDPAKPFALWCEGVSLADPTLDPQEKPPDPTPPSPQPPKSPANPRRPVWRLVTDIGSGFAHLPSRDTAYWLAGGGTLSLLLHPEDGQVNRTLLAKG